MFNVAKVKFLVSSSNAARMMPVEHKEFEYRIPAYLEGEVQKGSLVVVSWRKGMNEGGINPGLAEVVDVVNALDGTYQGTDYAFVVDVVDTARYVEQAERERRRARLLKLIEAEHERMLKTPDLDKLRTLSPELAKMVDEFRSLDHPFQQMVKQGSDIVNTLNGEDHSDDDGSGRDTL